MALSLTIKIGGSLWSALGFDAAFPSLLFEFQALVWESGVKARGAPKLRAHLR
jgi:hypothetical protein